MDVGRIVDMSVVVIGLHKEHSIQVDDVEFVVGAESEDGVRHVSWALWVQT